MSALKPLALGILLWGIIGGVVRADPIRWQIGVDDWAAYFAGQSGGDGNAAAAPISNSAQAAPISDSVAGPVSASPDLTWGQPASTPTVIATAPSSFNQPPSAVPTVPSSPSLPTAGPASSGPVDAYINLGTGPYPQQSTITTGNALPWYNSSQISSFFGGQPTSQQIQSFDNAILQRVQQTFSQSGVAVTLTTNPNVSALHTISLVSNTSSASLPNAIGMTQVGSNGFSFIDHITPSAQSLDQLEWIVAHNISHELMLAFGVPENYDKSGNYIDSKLASWSMMVSPSSTFSPAASQALSQVLASQNNGNSAYQLGAQEFNPQPAAIPEPTTLALWAVAAAAAVVSRRIRSRRSQARLQAQLH